MLKNLLSIFVFAFAILTAAYGQVGQGEIRGKIKDQKTGEGVPFANVVATLNGNQVAGATSDIDGNYSIKPISPGKYLVQVSVMGYNAKKVDGVVVNSDQISFVNVSMQDGALNLDEVVISTYKDPLIKKDNTTSGQVTSQEDFENMAIRSASDVAKNTAGVYAADDGTGDLNIRGARSDANYYYIDGMKVLGSNTLPKGAIGEIAVLTGGVSAQYGDVTGGVISITTKGPSADYHGSVEYLTSGFKFGDEVYGLDKFGYNVLEGAISGPLLMKKDSTGAKTNTPLVGFFVSGNYTHQVDSRPSAIGNWKVNDDVLEDLKRNPVSVIEGQSQTIQRAELLDQSSFTNVPTRLNRASTNYVINGKLDFVTGNNTNLTFGGSYNGRNYNEYGYTRSLYNYEHNPYVERNDWRVFGRFVQRFGKSTTDENDKSVVKNAYYSIQFGYNETNFSRSDENHGDDYWKYGFVGQFDRFQQRAYETQTLAGDGSDSLYLGWDKGWVYKGTYNVQTSFEDTLIGFTPGQSNPEMTAYTSNYYSLFGWEGYDENGNPIYDKNRASNDEDGNGFIFGNESNFYLRNQENIQNSGGYLNGSTPRSIYGLWQSPAQVYNGVNKTRNQQYRVSLMGSADIKKHAVSAGFEYEQRVTRGYSIAPRGLWTIGNLRTNSHLQNLDVMSPILSFEQTNATVSYDRLNAAPGEYRGEVNEDVQSFFDYNVRKNLGLNPDGNDFIDFNSLTPEELRLDFFSPSELLNNGNSLVSYYGYDAYGNMSSGASTLDDFFNEVDENGNYTRPIDAFRPNYIAGWIQDKYAFDDLVFNVGLRIDRLDLNQSVLKDKYSLFPTVKAGEAEARDLAGDMEGYSIPGSIGDDYVVYVDDVRNPSRITGYRDGDIWYSVDGSEVASSDVIRGESPSIQPLLVDKENTRSSDITTASFEDYTPTVNFMPRIAFSFPINEEALFFAHYDVLTRRPSANGTGASRLNILDYYYMDQASGNDILNNPALQPSQTIDYAVGFKQVITKSSAISLEAFYRELRNLVQVVGVKDAYPRTYTTYGNIDFGTVKGLVLSYDLRRTKNIRLTASYTLQFASGTGSDAFSAQNLVRAGKQNLRNISPLNYDQRHNIVTNFDYRFGMGDAYNGPTEMRFLEGMGANLILNVGSGTPYSRQRQVTGEGFITPVGSSIMDGSVNGSRLPWQFRMDFKIDKDFMLTKKDSKHPVAMNVYFQMFNVLNTLNINRVYRYTGQADDDAYLTDPLYQNDIEGQLNEESFRAQYQMKINNPGNYNLPRRSRIGVMVSF